MCSQITCLPARLRHRCIIGRQGCRVGLFGKFEIDNQTFKSAYKIRKTTIWYLRTIPDAQLGAFLYKSLFDNSAASFRLFATGVVAVCGLRQQIKIDQGFGKLHLKR